jgi:ABC-type Fe3+/spermidine/putrescine transport system ATPase subunit
VVDSRAVSASIISIEKVSKRYASAFVALKNVDLEIRRGELFALLGPNGAGKTTLINIVCGIVNPSAGRVIADGHDIVREARLARSKIGLVPQELATDMFETVWATVTFSRGLFGKPRNPAFVEKVLRDLSLWEKRDAKNFDREYLEQMVDDHESMAKLLANHAKDGDDADTVAYARKHLPKIQQHLQHAIDLKRVLTNKRD